VRSVAPVADAVKAEEVMPNRYRLAILLLARTS
jgi:hypothetical protein